MGDVFVVAESWLVALMVGSDGDAGDVKEEDGNKDGVLVLLPTCKRNGPS